MTSELTLDLAVGWTKSLPKVPSSLKDSVILSSYEKTRENTVTAQEKRHSVSAVLLQDLGKFVLPLEAKGIVFSGFCKIIPLMISHLHYLYEAAVLKDAVM